MTTMEWPSPLACEPLAHRVDCGLQIAGMTKWQGGANWRNEEEEDETTGEKGNKTTQDMKWQETAMTTKEQHHPPLNSGSSGRWWWGWRWQGLGWEDWMMTHHPPPASWATACGVDCGGYRWWANTGRLPLLHISCGEGFFIYFWLFNSSPPLHEMQGGYFYILLNYLSLTFNVRDVVNLKKLFITLKKKVIVWES